MNARATFSVLLANVDKVENVQVISDLAASPVLDRTIRLESAKESSRLEGLRIGYVMNQHPSPSVSFIRREIAGIEHAGGSVRRFSIRRWKGDLVDPADHSEVEKTTYLLDAATTLLWSVVVCAVSSPLKFIKAARLCAKVGWRSERGPFRTWMYLFEACRLRLLTTKEQIPWLHAHFGTNSAAVAMFCRVLGGPCYSFTVHGPEEFDRPELLHLEEKIHHASMVIAISKYGRSQLYRWCPWEQWDKIQIVRCGISENFAGGIAASMPEEPNLVCVARLAEQKGLPILIEAAARLKSLGVPFHLSLIGDGALRGPIERLIDREQLHSHVTLKGWQTEKQVRAAIEQSRALVLPSFAEGLPVVFMESLALGRPVISTKIAGISELVVDGENGWLVDAGDVDSLVEAMTKVLTADVEKLASMGISGMAAVFENHLARSEALRLGLLIRDRLSNAA